MALHFYMNGTTGAQDGVEISNGDLSNPLIFDGFYAASGVELSKDITIHIRADAGEKWHFVLVDIDSATNNPKIAFKYVDKQNTGRTANMVRYTYNGYTSSSQFPFFQTISDVNVPIIITGYAKGGEVSPSTSVKLVVTSGVKE